MVAGADNHRAFALGAIGFSLSGLSRSALYLHLILKERAMRKIITGFLAVILFFTLMGWYNSSPRVIISRLAHKGQIRCGQLRYKIYLFGFLPVGESVFSSEKIEEYNGQKVYHLSATSNPLKIYAKFFKGYATLDSYVDIGTLNPVLFRQKLFSPGKESADKEVIYNQREATMSLRGVTRQILPNTQDPLSLIFNIRRMDFSQDRALEMNINTNQKNYGLEGWAEPREISVNNKKYKLVFLTAEIKRRDKNPYHRSKVKIVLLKEETNIPISIRVFASGILINARLIETK
jgi:hypothetical protein